MGKQCNKCSVDLVVGENWYASSKKNSTYNCNACQYARFKSYNYDMHTPERIAAARRNDKKSYQNRKHRILATKDKSKRKIKPGIYGIFSDCKLIYIGESKQPLSRSHNHFSRIGLRGGKKKTRTSSPVALALTSGELQRDNLVFKMLEYIDDTPTRKQREQRLIQRYKPKYNDVYVLSNIQ